MSSVSTGTFWKAAEPSSRVVVQLILGSDDYYSVENLDARRYDY